MFKCIINNIIQFKKIESKYLYIFDWYVEYVYFSYDWQIEYTKLKFYLLKVSDNIWYI